MRVFVVLLFILPILVRAQKAPDRYDRLVDSLSAAGQSAQIIPALLAELKKTQPTENLLRHLGKEYIEVGKPADGEKYYRRALGLNPTCARCYLNLSRAAAMRGDLRAALTRADSAIALQPMEAPSYAVRGQIHDARGDALEALMDFNKAVALDSTDVAVLLARASYNVRHGYLSLALADADAAVRHAPGAYEPLLRRANIHYDAHRYGKGLADLNAAVHLDSSRHELYTGRGAVYLSMDSFRRAVADYSTAIVLNPADPFPYYSRAQAVYKLEEMDGFCTDLHAAAARYKSADTAARAEVAHLLGVYCDSSKASYYYQRGVALYNLGQYAKAVEIYTAGLRRTPANAMLLSFRGNAYVQLAEHAAALADYRASARHKVTLAADIELNKQKGNAAAKTGATEAAVTLFLADMQVSAARTLAALSRYAEALEEINAAIAQWPAGGPLGPEQAYNVRGYVFLATDEPKKAVADFDRCIRLAPRFAEPYVHRALALYAQAAGMQPTITTLSVGVASQSYSTGWKLPARSPAKGQEAVLRAALTDCNRAIELDAKIAFAWYLRGAIKASLGHPDYCVDLLQAVRLRYAGDEAVLRKCTP